MKTLAALLLLIVVFASAVHAAGAPVTPYPLKTCIVTDNDLGSMGDEQRTVYEGREIKFCCKPCEKRFLKKPAKYLEKLTPRPAP
jgi:hypothetical protein